LGLLGGFLRLAGWGPTICGMPSDNRSAIHENVRRILAELPDGVALVAAAKGRSVEEIVAAVDAGVRIVGQNYVQEAEAAVEAIGKAAEWHLIGHLQRNKAKDAVRLFDMVESVDSLRLARRLDRECAELDRKMPILIEINSGREPQKSGVLPEEALELVAAVARLERLDVRGLMTMGPFVEDPEELRPGFRETRALFEKLAVELRDVRMEILSMGMSDSYRVAIEEGATMVRIGTALFGPRPRV